jgi:hypothetical protein
MDRNNLLGTSSTTLGPEAKRLVQAAVRESVGADQADGSMLMYPTLLESRIVARMGFISGDNASGFSADLPGNKTDKALIRDCEYIPDWVKFFKIERFVRSSYREADGIEYTASPPIGESRCYLVKRNLNEPVPETLLVIPAHPRYKDLFRILTHAPEG